MSSRAARLRVTLITYGAYGAIACVACGGLPAGSEVAHSTSDAGASDAGVPTAEPASELASLDAVAARGAADAPLMRERMRVERLGARSAEVVAERDLCVRAFFSASAPVRVSFVDSSGAMRGDASATATAGTAPRAGPCCMKKGESVHLVVDGDAATHTRAVVFGAP